MLRSLNSLTSKTITLDEEQSDTIDKTSRLRSKIGKESHQISKDLSSSESDEKDSRVKPTLASPTSKLMLRKSTWNPFTTKVTVKIVENEKLKQTPIFTVTFVVKGFQVDFLSINLDVGEANVGLTLLSFSSLSDEDKSLLIWWDSFPILDLNLDVLSIVSLCSSSKVIVLLVSEFKDLSIAPLNQKAK